MKWVRSWQDTFVATGINHPTIARGFYCYYEFHNLEGTAACDSSGCAGGTWSLEGKILYLSNWKCCAVEERRKPVDLPAIFKQLVPGVNQQRPGSGLDQRRYRVGGLQDWSAGQSATIRCGRSPLTTSGPYMSDVTADRTRVSKATQPLLSGSERWSPAAGMGHMGHMGPYLVLACNLRLAPWRAARRL